MASDFYGLLGVDRTASDDELKRAYRRRARELHPDANGGDQAAEARFKEVTEAYETLRDPEARRRYDTFGTTGARQGAPSAEDLFGGGGGLGDLFGAFFAGNGGFGGQSQGARRRGSDVEVVLELAFEEAVFGVRQQITVRGPLSCATCAGSGSRPGTTPVSCPDCQGSGQIRHVRQSILGQMVTSAPCARCRGLGEVVSSACSDCQGEGRRTEERTITVEVPAGVDDGATLRISGAGGAALRGGVAGDLYVHLRVAPHARFERAGSDLLTTAPISFSQAALGTSLDLETLEGVEQIKVPPGTQTETVLRLRHRGVPHLKGRGRGDLHVRFVVETPTKLAKDEEALLRQLAELRGETVDAPEGGLLHRIRSTLS